MDICAPHGRQTSRAGLPALFRCCALAAFLLTGGPAWGLADLDPLDPESCKHPDGPSVVNNGWLDSVHKAHKAGQLSEDQFYGLSVWWVQLMTTLSETRDEREACEAMIKSRLTHGF